MYTRTASLAIAALLVAVAATESLAQVRVSVATDGTEADNHSFLPAMSGTGRFVAFTSFASNLVAGDTNGVQDVFLRDRDADGDGVFDEAGAVSTVRVSQRGAVQGIGGSNEAAITPDGRYVVFSSFAANLFSTAQVPLAASVILRWDRLTGDIVLVSQTAAGEPLLAARSVDPDVSDDGNHIVFTYGGSLPSEVAAGFAGVIYHRDVGAGTLTRVINTQGGPEGATFRMGTPSISADGGTIAYGLRIESGGITMITFAHVVDAATNTIRASYVGAQPSLSRDGAFLAFIDAQGGNSMGPAVRVHMASADERRVGAVFSINSSLALSPSGRYLKAGELVDFFYGAQLSVAATGGAFDAADTQMAYWRENFVPNRPVLDVVVANLSTLLDRDADGLNDHWEGLMGLSPSTASGLNGADGDPDDDGLTNAEEFARGSHPTGTSARFLAEGASGTFFATRYAIANQSSGPTTAALRLELDGGGLVRRTVSIGPGRTVTFDSRALGLGNASFSAVVESSQPVVVDRLMTWGSGGGVPYGSHAETSAATPGTSWFLAEGSTVLGFQLFYLLQNPQATPTTATVRYLLPSGPPIVRTYELPAQSRVTIVVNDVAGLGSTDVSAQITATQPIAVERAMYRSAGSQVFALGHDAAAVAAPSPTWFFGEGATGPFFDTFLLLANPSGGPATVQVEYLRDQGGAVNRSYTVAANTRFSVYVDGEPGMAGTAFGTRVSSDVPIVAERAMYWAGGFFDYYEGHVSSGATQAGSRWVLAGAEQGGAYGAETFVLIANTGATEALVFIRTLPETGPVQFSATLRVPGHTRLTFPASALSGFTRGGLDVREVIEQGGTLTGALVVEGAIYWSVPGQPFAAGANWPATLVP
jgi:hypothetical protein